MSRLVLVLLLSTAVNTMYTETVRKINERVVELFNADKFSQLVTELFHEDAIFSAKELTKTSSPGLNVRYKGRPSIQAHFEGVAKAYGKLSELEILETNEEGAVVLVTQGTIKLIMSQKIKDNKFTEIDINFYEL